MLERYDKKKVRLVTEDGDVLTGKAEYFASGFGLVEFGREEESLRIRGTHIFLSQIREVEEPGGRDSREIPRDRYDGLIGDLLERPCVIVDILPEQVPADSAGQYFAVDRYFRGPERLSALYRRFASVLLRLNCYDDMAVTFDGCEHWEINPDPESFTDRLAALPKTAFFRAVFEERKTMIDLDAGDTFMAAFDPDEAFLDRLTKLAASEGLFVWNSPEG